MDQNKFLTKTDLLNTFAQFGVSYNGWKNYPLKRLKSFKLTRDARDEYLDDNNVFLEEDAFNAVCALAIQTIISQHKFRLLKNFDVVTRLLPPDKEWLIIAIYELVLFFATNGTVYEDITGGTLQNTSFQFNASTSRNILTSDPLGTYVKNNLNGSEIEKYKFFETKEEATWYKRTVTGMIEIIDEW